ncbi:MAG: hypothetical protein EA412_00075 [Chitinophagaceae bacterium]|nr:MAG: hypothetical protein EA412_00075 [Chitinophagaceae bacterium]
MKHLNLKTMIIIVFMSTLLLNSSCKKDEQHPFVNTEWQIVSAQFHIDSNLVYPEPNPERHLIKFDDNNNYFLQLNNGHCSGKILFKNIISFDTPLCTLNAWHSQFGNKLVSMLTKFKHYKYYIHSETTMQLIGIEGEIINLEKN